MSDFLLSSGHRRSLSSPGAPLVDDGASVRRCAEDAATLDLLRQVRAAGLMDRRYGYYLVKILVTVAALTAGWVGLVAVGDSWVSLVIAAYLGLAFTQTVFVGHDAGHHQIFQTRKANGLVGLVAGNLLTGVSFGWWVPKHGAHHAHPNDAHHDPDIGPGVIAFTAASARGRRGLAGWMVRHQAGLVVPLLLLEAPSLLIVSVGSIRGRWSRPSAKVEALLIVVHTAAYLALVLWVLSPARAVAFVAVQQSVFGLYLGCSFAPNHKGMPIVEDGGGLGLASRQVLTARNVAGGRLVTFMLGGLDYQIEHHLFPTMPRPNLARAQHMVRAFCADNGLPYEEATLLASYRRALHHLHVIGSGGAPVDPVRPL